MRPLKLLLIALLAICPAFAEKVADLPAPTAYVDDFANVMTPAGKAQVEAVCRDVHNQTKAQIFVVIIKSLDGESIAPFANELFHNWKIGEKKTDRGILVLIVQDHHRWRLEVGYGLEGILPDAKAGRIGRTMDPLLKANNYDAAAKVCVDAIAAAIADDAKVTLAGNDVPAPPESVPDTPAAPTSRLFALLMFMPFFAFFLIFGVVVWISLRRRRQMLDSGQSFSPHNHNIFYTPGSSSDSFSSSSSSSDDSSSSSDDFSGGDGGDSGGGGADGGGE